jgi:hypothetical protein
MIARLNSFSCPQIKKPVVKEWCYKTSDLKNPETRNVLAQFMTR